MAAVTRFLVIQETRCLGCDGRGHLPSRTQGEALQVQCSVCGGTGWDTRTEVPLEQALAALKWHSARDDR
jgi:DnaJ-class molecular chaperone